MDDDQLVLPERSPAAPPEGLSRGIVDYLRGGVPGAMRGAGMSVPDWLSAPEPYLNNPDVNEAIGMASPLTRISPEARALYDAMAKTGQPAQRIASKTGMSMSQVLDLLQARDLATASFWNKANNPVVKNYVDTTGNTGPLSVKDLIDYVQELDPAHRNMLIKQAPRSVYDAYNSNTNRRALINSGVKNDSIIPRATPQDDESMMSDLISQMEQTKRK
jgi:hypothetical protein